MTAGSEKQQEQAESLYQMGLAYWYGTQENQISDDTALSYFESAAKWGSVEALSRLAMYYSLEQYADYPKALQLATEAVEKGSFYAEFILAELYADGLGVAQDQEKADSLYKKVFPQIKSAVEQGNTALLVSLAYLYEQGLGTAENGKQAFKLYKQAADQGNATAAAAVGDYYANGYAGIEGDLKKAIAYYLQSAQANNVEAQYELATLYFEQGQTENAVKWYQSAANQGYSKAVYGLGNLYYNLQDYAKASDYFEQAEKLNNIDAVYSLGLLYENGFGVERNPSLALQKFTKAAEMGDSQAKVRLADKYFQGEGVTQNISKAVQLYQDAASQDDVEASYRLAEIYEDHFGDKAHLEQALVIYQMLDSEFGDSSEDIERMKSKLREAK